MTIEQENDLNNALLTLLYEWKIGVIDQAQALKEFKQCLKYYSIIENVMIFRQDELVDVRRFEYYGNEKTIERVRKDMAEKISAEILNKECAYFDEVPRSEYRPTFESYRHFCMMIECIVPKKENHHTLFVNSK